MELTTDLLTRSPPPFLPTRQRAGFPVAISVRSHFSTANDRRYHHATSPARGIQFPPWRAPPRPPVSADGKAGLSGRVLAACRLPRSFQDHRWRWQPRVPAALVSPVGGIRTGSASGALGAGSRLRFLLARSAICARDSLASFATRVVQRAPRSQKTPRWHRAHAKPSGNGKEYRAHKAPRATKLRTRAICIV